MDWRPRYRILDAVPTKVNDEPVVVLQDPTDPSDTVVALSMPGFFVLTQCDGEHTVEEIHKAFTKEYGQEVPLDTVETMLREFDEGLLLEGERYDEHKAQRLAAYRAQATRPPTSAGSSYPADPAELRAFLDKMTEEADLGPVMDEDVCAIVIPHIDFPRGAATYGSVCRAVRELGLEFDTCVLLGIAHHHTETPFVVTRLPYETPLGVPEVDQAFIGHLQEHCSTDLFTDELVHVTEHSVEFATLVCQYLFGSRVRTVPILCGSFESVLPQGDSPSESPDVAEFIEALRTAIEESDGRVCLVAAVDFSHVGPQFGDSGLLTARMAEFAQRRDQALFGHCVECDPDGFFEEAHSDGNVTHVCGVAAVYTVLAVLEGRDAQGVVIHYGNAPTPDDTSVVTFAGMLFTELPAS